MTSRTLLTIKALFQHYCELDEKWVTNVDSGLSIRQLGQDKVTILEEIESLLAV